MLRGIEESSKQSMQIIEAIQKPIKEYKHTLRENIPKIYNKDLLEILFKHPYSKIDFLVEELGITRKTATSHLRAIEKLGILESIKVGREVYFVNKKLFHLLQNGSLE